MLARNISVVIPAYNAENFIEDALESIFKQSCAPGEVIVVDDGSGDRTSEIVDNWIAMRKPTFSVQLLKQRNCGISAARNKGIRSATGMWIALLDADDIFEANHLEELVRIYSKCTSAIAVYGAGRILVDGVLQETRYDDLWDNPSEKFGTKIDDANCLLIGKKALPRLIKGNFIKPSSFMFSTDAALDVGLFNEDLGTSEDREFLVRLLKKGNFIYTPMPITQYRWHDDNASQTKNARRNSENSLRALKVIFENRELNLNESEISACIDALESNVREYLYLCSKVGPRFYFNGVGFVKVNFGSKMAYRSVNLRNLVRCFISILPRKKNIV